MKFAPEANPGVERYQVWIRVQQENETYARQAMILNIVPPENVRLFTPEEINQNYIGEYQIGIERTPFWEDPYPYPATTDVTGIGVIGGMAQLTETINGDVPARLAKMSMSPEGGALHGDYFVGFKTSRFGTAANFVPIWSLKDGHFYPGDVTTTSESSAYSGTMVVCDFSGIATLRKRVGMLLSYVTANDLDQRGTYSVLLRARMSDNTTIARVRMAYGFGYESGGGGNEVTLLGPTYRSRVIVNGALNSTYWGLFEIGNVAIPPVRIPNGSSLDNYAITLDAERLSGSGSLQMDCLILIPNNDGFSHLRLPSAGDISATDHMILNQYADGSLAAISDVAGTTIWSPVAYSSTTRWGLPANNERPYIVIAAQMYIGGPPDSFRSIKGEKATMAYGYIPRWRTLRGNDT